jgi:hypothetical protein
MDKAMYKTSVVQLQILQYTAIGIFNCQSKFIAENDGIRQNKNTNENNKQKRQDPPEERLFLSISPGKTHSIPGKSEVGSGKNPKSPLLPTGSRTSSLKVPA